MFKRESAKDKALAMFDRRQAKDARAARRLGWVSLGVAASELFATRKVEDMLGIDDDPQRRGILRVLGVREMMHGIGILTERKLDRQLRVGVWSRVLGDVLDNVLFAVASTKTRDPGRLAVVGAALGVIGWADVKCAARLQRHKTEYAY